MGAKTTPGRNSRPCPTCGHPLCATEVDAETAAAWDKIADEVEQQAVARLNQVRQMITALRKDYVFVPNCAEVREEVDFRLEQIQLLCEPG